MPLSTERDDYQQLKPYPDYHPTSPLSFEPFGVLMVWRLISLRGCLPPPLPPLQSELLLERRISNTDNPFQAVLIENDCFRSVH